MFGGLLSGGEYNGTFTNDIQRIHLPTGTATIVGHLPVALAHAMGADVGGQLLVIGGSTPTTTSAAVYRFNPATNAISRVATLPAPLTDAAVATIGNSAYLLSGISAGPRSTQSSASPQRAELQPVSHRVLCGSAASLMRGFGGEPASVSVTSFIDQHNQWALLLLFALVALSRSDCRYRARQR